jgi:hypothetical protein
MRFNGTKLMKLRVKAGFKTRPDFADAMKDRGAGRHVSKAHIRAWEVLDAMPSADSIVIIADILGIEPKDLLVPTHRLAHPAAEAAR